MLSGAPRVCVITGGSSGIGLATAIKFVEAGDHVAICARDPERLAAATTRLQSLANATQQVVKRSLDVSQPGAVARFVRGVHEQLGRVDILVSNAGYPPRASITNITREQFDRAMAINVAATFEGTQAVWPLMVEQGGGVIVNMSSMAAVDPFAGFSVYGACKAWNELFTQAVASEGEEVGIRVVCVRPGAVDTPMLRALFPDFPDDQLVTPQQVAEEILAACDLTKQAPDGPIQITT